MYQRIVVPLDGSKVSEAVLPQVTDMAKALDAEVVLLRVNPVGGLLQGAYILPAGAARTLERDLNRRAKSYLDYMAEGITKHGVSVQTVVISGPVAESIVDWAVKNNADLIAMMSHGLGRAARWVFGSVADKLLQSSPIPVLVVRASKEVMEAQEEFEEEQLDKAVLKALTGANT